MVKILILSIGAFFVSAAFAGQNPAADAETPAAVDTDLSAQGFADPVTRAFAAHDPNSAARIDWSEWSAFLAKTTVDVGFSQRRLGRGEKRKWVGSNLSYGNAAPTRLEGTRVALDLLTPAHGAFVRDYRARLEALGGAIPLGALNRDEQLAYWLNLYNARVMELVIDAHPAETTDDLRARPGREDADDPWATPSLTVAGVDLSLRDIETRILFPIWDDPLVLYGLWQGAIGGPSLHRAAFEGPVVRAQLAGSADEFVNSNRGTRPKGEKLEVSWIYGWGAALFDGEDDVRAHIASLIRPPFSDGFETTETIDVDLYDHHVADLSGGTRHQGQWNNMAALSASDPRGGQVGLFIADMIRKDDTRRTQSPTTIELLREIQIYNDLDRTPTVEIIDLDCAEDDDECGRLDETDADAAGEPSADEGR